MLTLQEALDLPDLSEEIKKSIRELDKPGDWLLAYTDDVVYAVEPNDHNRRLFALQDQHQDGLDRVGMEPIKGWVPPADAPGAVPRSAITMSTEPLHKPPFRVRIKNRAFTLPDTVLTRDEARAFLADGSRALPWLRTQTGDAEEFLYETWTFA